jgi:hypothetical protein
MLSIAKSLIHVPKRSPPANAYIVGAFAIRYGAPLNRLARVKHYLEVLKLKAYKITGIFCSRSRLGDYQYNRFSNVTYDVLGQERHGHRFASLSGVLRFDAGAVLLNVGGCPDKVNARHF